MRGGVRRPEQASAAERCRRRDRAPDLHENASPRRRYLPINVFTSILRSLTRREGQWEVQTHPAICVRGLTPQVYWESAWAPAPLATQLTQQTPARAPA